MGEELNEAMDMGDWTKAAAEELVKAMAGVGIECVADAGPFSVNVIFKGHQAASALISILSVHTLNDRPGFLRDRISGGCISLNDISDQPVSENQVAEVVRVSWTWDMHPYLRGAAVLWHTAADIPLNDVMLVTSILNGLNGGAV